MTRADPECIPERLPKTHLEEMRASGRSRHGFFDAMDAHFRRFAAQKAFGRKAAGISGRKKPAAADLRRGRDS